MNQESSVQIDKREIQSHECSRCGGWVEYGGFMTTTKCPDCGTWYNINYDAEFTNGSWRNRTTLTERFPPVLFKREEKQNKNK